MLALAPTAVVRADFARWYLDEFTRQIDGDKAPPLGWPAELRPAGLRQDRAAHAREDRFG